MKKILNYKGYIETPTFEALKDVGLKTLKDGEAPSEHRKVLEINKNLLTNDTKEGGGRFFQDTVAIEKAMNKYMEGGAMSFANAA